jgi:hypothetical protein
VAQSMTVIDTVVCYMKSLWCSTCNLTINNSIECTPTQWRRTNQLICAYLVKITSKISQNQQLFNGLHSHLCWTQRLLQSHNSPHTDIHIYNMIQPWLSYNKPIAIDTQDLLWNLWGQFAILKFLYSDKKQHYFNTKNKRLSD